MLPETCRVVKPMKLEFIASVDFIHKDTGYLYFILVVRCYRNKKFLYMPLRVTIIHASIWDF